MLTRVRALVVVPALALLLAFVVGAGFLILSSPLIEGSVDLLLPVRAYASLLRGRSDRSGRSSTRWSTPRR